MPQTATFSKFSQVPQEGPSQTSPPSNITADKTQTLSINDIYNKSSSNDKAVIDMQKDQPTNKVNKSASSSLSSPVLHDTISKLSEIFNVPSETNSNAKSATEQSFESLAIQSLL